MAKHFLMENFERERGIFLPFLHYIYIYILYIARNLFGVSQPLFLDGFDDLFGEKWTRHFFTYIYTSWSLLTLEAPKFRLDATLWRPCVHNDGLAGLAHTEAISTRRAHTHTQTRSLPDSSNKHFPAGSKDLGLFFGFLPRRMRCREIRRDGKNKLPTYVCI